MAQAREELGADAALITSRPSPPEARYLGEYEVVFAAETTDPAPAVPALAAPPPVAAPSARRATPQAPPPEAEDALQSVLAELRGLRQQILRHTALRASDGPRWMASRPEAAEAYAALLAAEVDSELALGMLLAAHDRSQGAAPAAFAAALRVEMERMIPVDADLGADGAGMVALVGPPGAGKTATLAKLAVRFGVAKRRPVHFISLDTLRVAASEQLRTYASILGAGFDLVQSAGGLDHALREQRRRALVFIDTPGFTLRDLCDDSDDAVRSLAARDDIQKHLVLPAYMRAADLSRFSAAYAAFRPSRLLFTHLDQTETFGALLNEAVGSGLPLSFFGCGQQVPDDLEEASAAALAGRILPRGLAFAGARSAA
jgi:flagellar biosynthesis protein FlhF